MKAVLQKFVRVAFGYSLVGGLSAAISLLLLPLYIRVLTPAEYGVVDVILSITTLVVALVVFGVDQALNAFFFDSDEAYQARLGGTVLFSVVTIGFVVWLIFVVCSPLISHALFGNAHYTQVFRLISLTIVTTPLLTVLLALYRLRMSVLRVNVINGLLIAVNLATTFLFLVVLGMGLLGMAWATFSTQAIVVVVILLLYRVDLRLPFDRTSALWLYKAGATLLPATLSWLLLVNIDRVLLVQYVSIEELGLYSLANKLAMPLTIIFTISWGAWLPMALLMVKDPEAKRRYARMFEFFAAGSMLLSLTFGLFVKEGLSIISREEYQGAASYAIALMAFTGPITFMGAYFNVAFYAGKSTHLVTIVNVLGAGCNIALNLLLNPMIGVWGAVLATLIAGLASLLLAYSLSQRIAHVSYRWANTLPIIMLYALTVGYFAFASEASIRLKLAALAVFLVAILACDLIPRHMLYDTVSEVRNRIVSRRSV